MKYYIIAGEASGDLHGSNLMKGILAKDKDADIRFWGGSMMESVGGVMVRDYAEGAVMGISDIIAKAGMLLGNINFCKRDILECKPDVVILIDYPGFNFKIAQFAHEHGFKVFYYIAPKTWASREKRNRKLKDFVDRLYIVFPFEIPYFRSKGIDFIYKGNPLVDAVDNAKTECPYEGKYVAVLAGSRKGEISRMMPVCMEAAKRLHATAGYADYKFLIAGAPARNENDYLPYMTGCEDFVKLVFGRTYDVLKYARSAIINSGTASLEAALIGTPQLVAWSTSRLTAFIARKILKVNVKFISLGNLIIDKYAFREFIQEEFTVENIIQETRRLIEDEPYRNAMIADYADIRKALGGTGASEAVASSMIEELS